MPPSKRSLPWENKSTPSATTKRQRPAPQSSQSSSSYNNRSQPIIVIDDMTDDDELYEEIFDELYEEIFSQPLLPEIDDHVSIGYMGSCSMKCNTNIRIQSCGSTILSRYCYSRRKSPSGKGTTKPIRQKCNSRR